MRIIEREPSIFTPRGQDTVADDCVTCGQPMDSAFCPYCGERRAADRKYTLGEFAREYFESIANFDGRIFRTIKTLLRRPGELTREFMRGSRLPYLQPLQCFLILNLGFFLWSGLSHQRVFDTPLEVHVNGQPYSGLAKRMIAAKLPAAGDARVAYVTRFDAVGSTQARSLVLAMVPMFALLLGLATIDRRRTTPVVQHLVFALHYYSLAFIVLSLSTYVIALPLEFVLRRLGVPEGDYGYDVPDSLAMMVVLAIYLGIALRRVYDIKALRSAITSVILGVGFYAVLQAYRMLLFFVTFYSI
jgi:hypothetical protein